MEVIKYTEDYLALQLLQRQITCYIYKPVKQKILSVTMNPNINKEKF